MKMVPVNPFDAAIAKLEKDFPTEFLLEVDDHMFRDVGSIANASVISRTMENMKQRAAEMQYVVTTIEDPSRRMWIYHFKRPAGATIPVKDAIDVASVPSLQA